MNQVLFQREFILSYENLPSIRKMLDDKAPSLQISPDLLQSLKLVSSEYCANLLEHQQKPADTITISYGKHEGLFQYSITDNGTAWPQQQQRLAEASLPNEPCESGMGLALIKATFPEYHYTSHPEFNQITFSLPQQPRQNHLVIVDDNRSQLAILTSYLEQHYQLAVFSTAQDALRWLNTNHCDLVLTDLHMPGINGIDFRQQVAALAQHRLLPFVFISGDSVTETMSTAAQSGIDDFLTKPINKQHLLQVLARILKRHQHLTQAFEDNILQQLDYSPLVEGTISAAHCHPDVVIQLDQDPTFSGDFFVRHTLLDGSSLMILGDMMGHGLIAKANGGINLGMIQGILMDPAITPDQLCERLNQYLFLSKPNSLVCLLIVHYGLDHTATLYNAGMPRPLACQNDCRHIDNTIGLLGLFESIQLECHQIVLAKGDSLHCYSDGLIESSLPTALRNKLISLPASERHQWLWRQDAETPQDDRSLFSLYWNS